MNLRKILFAAALASVATSFLVSAGGCPYGFDRPNGQHQPTRRLLRGERQLAPAGKPIDDHDGKPIDHDHDHDPSYPVPLADFAAVKQDIVALLTDSQDFWPADFGHYGPFFIRLAWHCAGTYRLVDGRGGCDGARIRHLPERAWEDNTNLDKALDLLTPLKLKYGASLSWGDLIALTGTTAIEAMGGPAIGFCGGRIDDDDGAESIELDPIQASATQAEVADCAVDGQCDLPLGATTQGLIYVNPEGPMGQPDPVGSAHEIRDTFRRRMGFTDRETVALIGGGHTFGKMHGACTTGPGPNPIDAPDAPWPGTCETFPDAPKGKGNNTFTSGFEHPWNRSPTKWTIGYFAVLKNVPLRVVQSTAGRAIWMGPTETDPPFRMLTTDVALINDDAYKALVDEFAADLAVVGEAFGAAWYKLLTLDMGPAVRCRGNLVPSIGPLPHQNPLPPAPAPHELPNFYAVRHRVQALLYQPLPGVSSDVVDNGKPYNGALFVHLAYQCASTFRATDYAGGCNGAKIRFAPQKDWFGNAGMDAVITALETIVKRDFPTLSTADLIVLAGQAALEHAGSDTITFVGGRVDALDGANVNYLAPRTYYKNALVAVRDDAKVRGLSPYEYVALAGRPRSVVQQQRLGFRGSFTNDVATVSNALFRVLLDHTWVKTDKDHEYQASTDSDVVALDTDVALLWDSTYKAIVQRFAADEPFFKRVFADAWAKLMTADHFATEDGYY